MKDGLFTQNPEYHEGSSTKRYVVTVTGTWNIDAEAYTPEEAEQLAYQECLANGIDVELMNLEFEAFDEADELLYCDEPTNDDEVEK
jgi:hypothetical protein